ncbi:MAG: hypothetical protein UZ08_BCD001002859 [Candidatus Parvibacillus calidus]|nr:MAG: hypothetical protein UZ08_BCD001002859 [Candidatus Parvibacillus calidus]
MNISIMIAKTLVAIVAIQHLFFMWLEMFAWETVGRKFFKGNRQGDFFRQTKSIAANQGLYNGFLAAGLIWSFLISDSLWQINVMTFFSWMCSRCRDIWRLFSFTENFSRAGNTGNAGLDIFAFVMNVFSLFKEKFSCYCRMKSRGNSS